MAQFEMPIKSTSPMYLYKFSVEFDIVRKYLTIR